MISARYKARKAAEKELSEEPEELEKEHRRLWAQSRNQPPSYEETVESQGTPQGAKNSTAPDMKMPPGSRGLGNTQDPTPELVH